jgi:histidine triad (HIT) family protein
MDCLFCKIAAKEIPTSIVYEDDATLGILDVHPRSPGHTMVIPKAHAENILDLPPEAVGPVFTAVKKVTSLLQKSLQPDGFTIGVNHGRVSGQTVDHLHIHIMPRWNDDGGGSIHSVVNNPPQESLEEIRTKILTVK